MILHIVYTLMACNIVAIVSAIALAKFEEMIHRETLDHLDFTASCNCWILRATAVFYGVWAYIEATTFIDHSPEGQIITAIFFTIASILFLTAWIKFECLAKSLADLNRVTSINTN